MERAQVTHLAKSYIKWTFLGQTTDETTIVHDSSIIRRSHGYKEGYIRKTAFAEG
jgi:hypothetical protein